MRCFILFLAVILLVFFIKYEHKIMEMEFIVFEMYKDGFEEYLDVDEYSNLYFKKDEIKEYLEEKGYKVSFDVNLKFTVFFKYLFDFSKEFSFLLEENYEFEQ